MKVEIHIKNHESFKALQQMHLTVNYNVNLNYIDKLFS